MPLLEVREISKSFPGVQALQDVSFGVEEGEILSILGPSGCGKTTLLRVIAGLETPEAGQILFAGQDLREIPAHQRNFGLMFQDYALFPHLDVFANVAFGLRMQNMSADKVQARVGEVLELVGLAGYEGRDVNQLSGGEQQRVALARSLAPQPRLLMLDEPLGSLDRSLRERLLEEIPGILKRVGVTAIYVTHDQEEALALGDRVLIMDRGKVIQIGTSREVYRQPANAFVARFLGMSNLIPSRVVEISGHITVHSPIGLMRVESPTQRHRIGEEVLLLIPPDAVNLLNPANKHEENILAGRVVEISFRGERMRLIVDTEAGLKLAFTLDSSPRSLPQPGEKVNLTLENERLLLLPAEEK